MRLFSGFLTLLFLRAFDQPHPPLRGPPSPSRGRLALVHRSLFSHRSKFSLGKKESLCPGQSLPPQAVPLPLLRGGFRLCIAVLKIIVQNFLSDRRAKEGVRTSLRRPLVRGAGLPKASLRGLTGREILLFSRAFGQPHPPTPRSRLRLHGALVPLPLSLGRKGKAFEAHRRFKDHRSKFSLGCKRKRRIARLFRLPLDRIG